MSAEYEVGYCKPPKHAQFRPGQSGNLKGRQKGVKNAKTILNEELSEKITVQKNNKTKKVSKLSALMTRLVNAALQGNLRAARIVLEFLEKGEQAEEKRRAVCEVLSAEDRTILEDFIAERREADND